MTSLLKIIFKYFRLLIAQSIKKDSLPSNRTTNMEKLRHISIQRQDEKSRKKQ